MEVVDRREGKEHLIPGVSVLNRRSLETHTTSEKTHTTHRAEELPMHDSDTPGPCDVGEHTGGLLCAQSAAPPSFGNAHPRVISVHRGRFGVSPGCLGYLLFYPGQWEKTGKGYGPLLHLSHPFCHWQKLYGRSGDHTSCMQFPTETSNHLAALKKPWTLRTK
mgnify:CR=1 FL=1